MSVSVDWGTDGPLLMGVAGWTATWVIAWAVFWRRRGAKWPLYTGLAPVLAVAAVLVVGFIVVAPWLLIPGGVVGVIFTIGLVTLIIALVAGRRSLFARSQLRAGAPTVSPRGLVE